MHERPTPSYDSMEHVDDDETKLCEVARHPFGIAVFYIQAGIGILGAVTVTFFSLPAIMEDTERAFVIASLIGVVIMLLGVLIIAVATYVYRQSRLIVTDRNITQILQYGLFNRKVSQLNMVNVEDVTSMQAGFLATMIGYGTLKIETAGEQANFNFTYCPRPGYYAKVILNARERILGQHDGDASVNAGVTTTR